MTYPCQHCRREHPTFALARSCYTDHVRALPGDLELAVYRDEMTLAEAVAAAVARPKIKL